MGTGGIFEESKLLPQINHEIAVVGVKKMELSTGLVETAGEPTGVKAVSSVSACTGTTWLSKMTALGVKLRLSLTMLSIRRRRTLRLSRPPYDDTHPII